MQLEGNPIIDRHICALVDAAQECLDKIQDIRRNHPDSERLRMSLARMIEGINEFLRVGDRDLQGSL